MVIQHFYYSRAAGSFPLVPAVLLSTLLLSFLLCAVSHDSHPRILLYIAEYTLQEDTMLSAEHWKLESSVQCSMESLDKLCTENHRSGPQNSRQQVLGTTDVAAAVVASRLAKEAT